MTNLWLFKYWVHYHLRLRFPRHDAGKWHDIWNDLDKYKPVQTQKSRGHTQQQGIKYLRWNKHRRWLNVDSKISDQKRSKATQPLAILAGLALELPPHFVINIFDPISFQNVNFEKIFLIY